MAANTVSVSSEFDIFVDRPVQTSTLDTKEIAYKPIASTDQSDLEFLIPAFNDTYIDLNMQLYVRGQLTMEDGAELDASDHTEGTNNFLHSLFSQSKRCPITPSSDD
jgi:hypothetical protein